MAAGARSPTLRRVAIVGISGRMGCALLRAAAGMPQLLVTGAVASASSLALGRDAGEVAGIGRANLAVTADLSAALREADVALDFSSAVAVPATLAACRAAGKPLLLGTTGLDPSLEPQLEAAAREIALLVAPNTSLGGAVLAELVRSAARALPASFDIDILDLHHRAKRDAPSGTALALGRAAADARGLLPPAPAAGSATTASVRPGPRGEGEIGFAAVRAGDLAGEHTAFFAGPGEELALTHRVRDRAVFARGALAAALWLLAQPPGRYEMRDFLGFKT